MLGGPSEPTTWGSKQGPPPSHKQGSVPPAPASWQLLLSAAMMWGRLSMGFRCHEAKRGGHMGRPSWSLESIILVLPGHQPMCLAGSQDVGTQDVCPV